MHAWLRLLVILIVVGALVTAAATLLSLWLTEERRLTRAFRKGLDLQARGARPDAALIAHGTGRGVALSLAGQRMVTVWDSGGWRMDYPLAELIGAELELDGEVAARVMTGEPRRLLDRRGGAEHEVRLRFLFDDAGHPDFDLLLWPPRRARADAGPREAIAEANRWLARLDAILRRAAAPSAGGARSSSPPPQVATQRPARPKTEPPPWEGDDLFDDDLEDGGAKDEDELAD